MKAGGGGGLGAINLAKYAYSHIGAFTFGFNGRFSLPVCPFRPRGGQEHVGRPGVHLYLYQASDVHL